MQPINLHSNMVRFIISIRTQYKCSKRIIYIPIWLDLLLSELCQINSVSTYLHSNMVRFIISERTIYTRTILRIYIPIWLDLL